MEIQRGCLVNEKTPESRVLRWYLGCIQTEFPNGKMETSYLPTTTVSHRSLPNAAPSRYRTLKNDLGEGSVLCAGSEELVGNANLVQILPS